MHSLLRKRKSYKHSQRLLLKTRSHLFGEGVLRYPLPKRLLSLKYCGERFFTACVDLLFQSCMRAEAVLCKLLRRVTHNTLLCRVTHNTLLCRVTHNTLLCRVTHNTLLCRVTHNTLLCRVREQQHLKRLLS